jgi:DNA-binding transcriptional ArsR family regulator
MVMPAALRQPDADEDDVDIFRAIADPTRRAILDHLSAGPATVNALAANFAQTRPGISKHLRVLRECGVVAETKSGRERHYRLRPAALRPVDTWLMRYRALWSVQLNALKAYLESDQ